MTQFSVHWRFSAQSSQRLHRVPLYAPALFWIREGTKRLHNEGSPLNCPAGQCLGMPAGETQLMENLPNASGYYQAEVFTPPRRWTERFLTHYGPHLPTMAATPDFACFAELESQLLNPDRPAKQCRSARRSTRRTLLARHSADAGQSWARRRSLQTCHNQGKSQKERMELLRRLAVQQLRTLKQ